MQKKAKLKREYVYLCTSLPVLILGEKPQLPSAEFLRSCEGPLEVDDYVFLSNLSFDSCYTCDEVDPPLDTFLRWELALRNAVAAKRHSTPLPMLARATDFQPKGGSLGAGVEALLQECLALDPLQAEFRLARERWRQLDFNLGTDRFNLMFLAVYRLQLLLAEQQQKWQEESGRKRYDQTCKTIFRSFKENNKE